MFKGVIFDLDGTLTDSMYVWEETDSEFLGRYGIEPDAEYQKAITTLNFTEGINYILNRYKLPLTPHEVTDELFSIAFRYYNEDIKLKPNVLSTLEKLKSMGIALGIATSCMKGMCEAVLKNNGAYSYFSGFTYSDETGLSKREPHIFREAASSLCLLPEECIVVEDAPHAARGAKASGAYVVGVYDEYSAKLENDMRQICDSFIMDISELIKIFG